MTADEATQLAKRICNTFRGGPPFGEWVDVFDRECGDLAIAQEVFRRLKYVTEFAPSIQRFKSEYDAIHATAPAAPAVVTLEPAGPKLTREERVQILLAAGCPERYIRASRTGTDDNGNIWIGTPLT